MLAGLDAHGAYLSPEELAEWKAGPAAGPADPGISVLPAGRALQVVAVDEGSPAEEAGLKVGDQIREIEGRAARELSFDQALRLIRGEPGSAVTLDVLHAGENFRHEKIEVARAPRRSRPYDLRVERGIGVLRLHELARVPAEELAEELDDVRSRGVTTLLLDLRNVADNDPRALSSLGGLLAKGTLLRLKNRRGEVLESVTTAGEGGVWSGSVCALVNGATAGSAEAIASLIQSDLGGRVVGEPTYGLGAQAKLYEMEDGSGLLVSAARWETGGGGTWHGEGVEPDEIIRGKGDHYEARFADQMERALSLLESPPAEAEQEAA
jgi:carboxyl-terminal processing protease